MCSNARDWSSEANPAFMYLFFRATDASQRDSCARTSNDVHIAAFPPPRAPYSTCLQRSVLYCQTPSSLETTVVGWCTYSSSVDRVQRCGAGGGV